VGIFSLVLHTHLPYVRRNGVWPCGEDFFHQAATESYLPLLGTLDRLAERGLRDALTLSISPMVAHQMADPHMLRELSLYLGRLELRTWQQVANYTGTFTQEFKDLAAFYARFGREQSDRLDAMPDLASGFAALEQAGVIEIIGGPATHPSLPLVREPALLDAQVRLGIAEHRRLFGHAPRGMWLPECAYRPDAGIEQLLQDNGIGHVVLDGPTVLRSGGTTFAPHRIGSSAVAAFGRNLEVTYRVWSPTGGYPSGRWYRDFYHYDVEGGFKNWRVTSVRKPLHRKRPYEPSRGREAAGSDAEGFAALIARTLEEHEASTGREGVVVAAYDTELFGHWWFEGPAFLEQLFASLGEKHGVRTCSLEKARALLEEPSPIDVVEGSWGFRKDHRSWVAEETEHMWETLGGIEAETVRMVEKLAGARGARARALAQLVREAFLAQASDWPFMVLRGRNAEYAHDRFEGHRARWTRLVELLGRDAPDHVLDREAAMLFETDNILPALSAADIAP